MLLKRVNNLCAQDKKRKENLPSGVPYYDKKKKKKEEEEEKKKEKKKKNYK